MTSWPGTLVESVDVPAGDIAVGRTRNRHLLWPDRRMRNEFTSVLTGKGLSLRRQSCAALKRTGYGCVYFAEQMLQAAGRWRFAGKRVCPCPAQVSCHICRTVKMIE